MSNDPYEFQQQKDNPRVSDLWESEKNNDRPEKRFPDWRPEPGPMQQSEDDGKESKDWESGKPKNK